MWGKSYWNKFRDGAPSSDHAHLQNARRKANFVISQEPVKLETWFLAKKMQNHYFHIHSNKTFIYKLLQKRL